MNGSWFRFSNALLENFDCLAECVAYNHRRKLYAYNVDAHEGGCRIILKTLTNGRAEICFINASSLERCIEVLDAWLNTTNQTDVKWKPDAYYKPR